MGDKPHDKNGAPRVTQRMPSSGQTPTGDARPTTRFPDAAVSRVLTSEERRAQAMRKAHDDDDRWASDSQVTERFQEDRPTDRFAPPQERISTTPTEAPAMPASLLRGELVDDRYRVEEGPLGFATGEAEVYRCLDTQTDAIVALKLYQQGIAPKTDVLDNLLNMRHPHVVTLHAYGAWAGRFFEVMDYCVGGSVADSMPLGEPAARICLEQVVSGMRYLHNLGIVHRDIKPNNLFFRKPDRQEIVIGDFGVSSILEADERVRKTRTATFFTLDYAAPELIDGKEVSAKTDYYALGITLLHLLAGVSPFHGMDKNTILGCHFRGNVPRPVDLSSEFRRLISGLLRVMPENRWGYRQVMCWLRGEAVVTDDGLPDRDEAYVGKRVPYRSLPEVGTPAEMAPRLDDFDVKKDLLRGYVSQWLMFFDTELGERVARLEDDFAENLDLGVFKLRFLLDPAQPLDIGNRKIYNIAQLAELLALPGNPYQPDIENLLYSESLDVWIDALHAGQEGRDLIQRLSEIRSRFNNPSLALFALLYTLDPARPLILSERAAVTSPEELAEALSSDPGLAPHVTQLLYGGYIEEWFRLCFPNREEDLRYVQECIQRHGDNRDLGLFAFQAYFCPSLSLRIGNDYASSPKELAALISKTPASFERGARLLVSGWIRTWLVATGRMRNPAAFDEVANDFTVQPLRKMEAVLHILDPELPWPAPMADVDAVDAGTLTTESAQTVRINVFNAGRGHLSGTVTLVEDRDTAELTGAFAMEPRIIEGAPVEVKVELRGREQPPGAHRTARVIVETNGGRLEIPISFRVSMPLGAMVLRTALVGILCGEVAGLLRLLLETCLPQCVYNLLDWYDWNTIAAHLSQWGFIPAALFTLTGLGGGLYYLFSMCRVNR